MSWDKTSRTYWGHTLINFVKYKAGKNCFSFGLFWHFSIDSAWQVLFGLAWGPLLAGCCISAITSATVHNPDLLNFLHQKQEQGAQRCFEVKKASDNTTVGRLSMTPVLNKHESQQHREGSPTDAMIPNLSSFNSSSWRVVKLLSLANALRNAPRRPWMVIADSAFPSVPLALEPPDTS